LPGKTTRASQCALRTRRKIRCGDDLRHSAVPSRCFRSS
jgi:hypothetical protein